MDLYDHISSLRKAMEDREQQIIDVLTSGGVSDMEKYNFLMGELSALNYIRDKIKEHLQGEDI
mgnify:FL=1|jgi:hypothetical protein|tara:strand:+ start:1511 stop:1699 length:189 start_codon:yes stop_codon:yes gene_type:complete